MNFLNKKAINIYKDLYRNMQLQRIPYTFMKHITLKKTIFTLHIYIYIFLWSTTLKKTIRINNL